ncbi:hypothetical protein FDECE_1359 [Fusarium decemcellulare]|nr:hypothetical protein FDECE_1359 [Fusarium decemcellulare]
MFQFVSLYAESSITFYSQGSWHGNVEVEEFGTSAPPPDFHGAINLHPPRSPRIAGILVTPSSTSCYRVLSLSSTYFFLGESIVMSQALGAFKCDYCPKRYKRIDYLIRHKRSHTKSKPYKCWTCFKSFARVDILKRHIAGHGSSIDIRSGCDTQEADPCRQDPLTRPYEDSAENNVAGTGFTENTQVPVPLGAHTMSECLQPNSKSLEPDIDCQDGSYVGIPDSGVSLGTWSLACSYQQDFSAEIGFSDVDLQLLDAFISTLPSGLYNPLPDTPEFWKSQGSIETTSSTTGRSNTDNEAEPKHDILLQAHRPELLEPVKHGRASVNLASSSRNRILTALVQWGSEDIARIIEVLPSVGPLNALLQSYLTTPVSHANTFIHVATFNPNEKRADLLLAMLASSCILSSDATLNKLGRVFQECVLATLPKHFEVGNYASRDLELAQAFLITLEVGVWSGFMRTTEAAESFFQPLLTMIRRTGMLKYSSYTPKHDSDQNGKSLQERWLEWLHLESWKRLVCRVYKHDTNTSIALQVNPLISYAEFCLPLPASGDMWSASSAEEWNSLVLAQQQIDSPQQVTLNDYMDDVGGIFVSESIADLNITREVFLSFAWECQTTTIFFS